MSTDLTIDGQKFDFTIMTLRWMRSEIIYAKWAASFHLTLSEIWVLLNLSIHGTAVSQNDIALETGLPKQTISYVINNLVKRGHVKRAVKNGDRRARLITLTKEGQTFFAPVLREIKEVGEQSITVLPAQVREEFLDAHKQYIQEIMVGFNHCIERRQAEQNAKTKP